jgi:glyoxylate reductase
MGRIGQAVARRAGGFGMKILYYDPHPVPAEALAGLDARSVTLDVLYAESDFISIHVPLVEDTHHLIDDAAFGKMKSDCVLVNTSRGPVVDETALVRALESRTIAAAGLDVYEHEPDLAPGLKALDNVVLTPHIASGSHATRMRMCQMAADNLVEALGGRQPPNLVNRDAWDRRRQ